MATKDYKKHPYHGIGFTDIPDVLKALQVLETLGLYKIEHDHAMYPRLNVRREVVLRDIRNALVNGNIKIRDEQVTKNGQYRHDWIILDEYALGISSARRGGYVAILEDRERFEEEHVQWNRLKPFKDREAELRKSAYAKLTPDERRAVGISNLRGVK